MTATAPRLAHVAVPRSLAFSFCSCRRSDADVLIDVREGRDGAPSFSETRRRLCCRCRSCRSGRNAGSGCALVACLAARQPKAQCRAAAGGGRSGGCRPAAARTGAMGPPRLAAPKVLGLSPSPLGLASPSRHSPPLLASPPLLVSARRFAQSSGSPAGTPMPIRIPAHAVDVVGDAHAGIIVEHPRQVEWIGAGDVGQRLHGPVGARPT
jgi:hypothetical protein